MEKKERGAEREWGRRKRRQKGGQRRGKGGENKKKKDRGAERRGVVSVTSPCHLTWVLAAVFYGVLYGSRVSFKWVLMIILSLLFKLG